eukprot:5710823-Pleurochrysis_carterae.AAC.1
MPMKAKMQKSESAGSELETPRRKANMSVSEVTVMETPAMPMVVVGRLERVEEHEHIVDANAEQDEGEHVHHRVERNAEAGGQAVRDADGEAARGDAREGEQRLAAHRVAAREHEQGVDDDEHDADRERGDVAADGAAQLHANRRVRLRVQVDRARLEVDGPLAAVSRPRGSLGDWRVERPVGANHVVHLVLEGGRRQLDRLAALVVIHLVDHLHRLGGDDVARRVILNPAKDGLRGDEGAWRRQIRRACAF